MSFAPQVLDHFRNPRFPGELPGATAAAEASNPVCGDVVKIWIQVDADTVSASTFKAAGCVPAIACASWLVERIQGVRLGEAASLSAEAVAAGLGGLPAASTHAAQLAVEALRKTLDEVRRAPNQGRGGARRQDV